MLRIYRISNSGTALRIPYSLKSKRVASIIDFSASFSLFSGVDQDRVCLRIWYQVKFLPFHFEAVDTAIIGRGLRHT